MSLKTSDYGVRAEATAGTTKVAAGTAYGLAPILCIGETAGVRQQHAAQGCPPILRKLPTICDAGTVHLSLYWVLEIGNGKSATDEK